MAVRVIGIGDSMVDKNLDSGIMYPGGQSLNIPVNMKFLGAESAFIGCFGNDYVAEHMKKTMDEIGIDYSHSHFYPVPNPAAHYRVIDNDRVFQRAPYKVHPMTRALFAMLDYEGFSKEDMDYIKSFDFIHCSNDSGIEAYYEDFKNEGIKMSFDFSVYYDDKDREGKTMLERVAPNAYFVLLSCAHLTETETQQKLVEAHTLGAKICIGTRGSKGSFCYDGDKFYHQPAHWLEDVVDTMGAGDAFISAFLYTFVENGGFEAEDKSEIIKKSLAFAAEYSAKVCMVEGSFGHGAPFER